MRAKTIQRTMRCEAAARNVQQANKFVNKCCQTKENCNLQPRHSSLSGSHSATTTHTHTHTYTRPHAERSSQLCILCACRFVCPRCCCSCCCRSRRARRLFICRKLLLILPYTIQIEFATTAAAAARAVASSAPVPRSA